MIFPIFWKTDGIYCQFITLLHLFHTRNTPKNDKTIINDFVRISFDPPCEILSHANTHSHKVKWNEAMNLNNVVTFLEKHLFLFHFFFVVSHKYVLMYIYFFFLQHTYMHHTWNSWMRRNMMKKTIKVSYKWNKI